MAERWITGRRERLHGRCLSLASCPPPRRVNDPGPDGNDRRSKQLITNEGDGYVQNGMAWRTLLGYQNDRRVTDILFTTYDKSLPNSGCSHSNTFTHLEIHRKNYLFQRLLMYRIRKIRYTWLREPRFHTDRSCTVRKLIVLTILTPQFCTSVHY